MQDPDPMATCPDMRLSSGDRQQATACLRDRVTRPGPGHPSGIGSPVHPGISGGPSSTFRPRQRSPAGMMR